MQQKHETSKLSAIGRFAWVHLPAIAVTLTVFLLYIAKVRWNTITAGELNAPQFAAKAHEAMILFSLTDILMHQIRYSLVLKTKTQYDDWAPGDYHFFALHWSQSSFGYCNNSSPGLVETEILERFYELGPRREHVSNNS